jgi:hypothetical protein
LFVEAVILVNSAENVEGLEEKAVALEVALRKLNEIIDDHPSSDLAVKLITNQKIGDTSLKDVARAAERAREEADRATERAREEAPGRAGFEMALKLAEQGDAKAQYKLGYFYNAGYGVPENYAEAVKWYRKAAVQGHADAQFSLGFMYNVGRGVPKNDTEAVKWWRKAAEQGLAPAQLNLGDMYRDGYGVPKNDVEAVKWYRKAAEQGNEVAKVWLKDLEAK